MTLEKEFSNLQNEIKEKEVLLLEKIIDALKNEEDDGEYGDLCCLLIDSLKDCVKNDVYLWMPINGDAHEYDGEYLVNLDDNTLATKVPVIINERLYHQIYTSKELVQSEYFINFDLFEAIKCSLVEKDISGLLINDFEIDRGTLGYLMGIRN